MSGSVGNHSSGHQTPPVLPDFDLIRCVGQGGFGQVWLATNRATGHLRAVKVISLERSGTTDPASREITSITRLEENVRTQHPNLLNIRHVGKTADHLFYVMDPADDVSGVSATADSSYRPATLQSRLADGPLPAEDCLRFARQLLDGLASLHTAGMVHRDVKPANCLFVAGQLKLADFGLLAEADPQISRVGTVKYMPPDGRMDAKADVYAAGLVIYEMLTGLPAESFPRLGPRAGEIAEDPLLQRVNHLVLRACQGDPQRRFDDAGEMLAELTAPKGRRPGPMGPWRWAAMIGTAMLLIGVAIATAVSLWPGRRPSEPTAGPPGVSVNFITEPYEATILLDGQPLLNSDGQPYTTPRTIPDIPTGVHRVTFQHEGLPDLQREIDFTDVQEIEARWKP